MARLDARARDVHGISLFLQPVQELNIEDRVSRGQYQFSLTSPDSALLAQWSQALTQRLAQSPALAEVSSDLQGNGRQAYLEVSRDTAARLGVTMDDVVQALYNAFGQRQVATLFTQSNQYRVVLEVDRSLALGPEALERIHLQTEDGQAIPLSALATVSERGAAGDQPSVAISGREPIVQPAAGRVVGRRHCRH